VACAKFERPHETKHLAALSGLAREFPRRLEQVSGAERVHGKISMGMPRRPIVDHQRRDTFVEIRKEPVDAIRIPDVEVGVPGVTSTRVRSGERFLLL